MAKSNLEKIEELTESQTLQMLQRFQNGEQNVKSGDVLGSIGAIVKNVYDILASGITEIYKESDYHEAYGDSSTIGSIAYNPASKRASEMKFNYLDYAKNVTANEKNGSDTTTYNSIASASSRYLDYGTSPYNTINNLFPDDSDKGNGSFTNKWRVNDKRSLLAKTKKLFREGKINSLISRFATNDGSNRDNHHHVPSGSASTVFGESRGRNLLTKDAEIGGSTYNINGYNNPYCRVWTHHHQYDNIAKTMRPFFGDGYVSIGRSTDVVKLKDLHNWRNFRIEEQGVWGWKNNNSKWDKSVLNSSNGLPIITPKYRGGGDANIHTKQCMFSIENLAWRGYDPYAFEETLSWEQRGPLGGRIMWFPPYGITFNENTTAQWNSNTFIGRGEDVYTYVNTQRNGTLSFLMVVDHPSIVDYANQNGNYGGVSDTDWMRFFAGCDNGEFLSTNASPTLLTDEYFVGGGMKADVRTLEAINSVIPAPDTVPVKEPETPKPEEPQDVYDDQEIILSFPVFYPNNYSGATDSWFKEGQDNFWNVIEDNEKQYYNVYRCGKDMESSVEPICYLLNGVLANKVYGKNAKRCDDKPFYLDVETNKKGNAIRYWDKKTNANDICAYYETGVGYEMDKQYGLSNAPIPDLRPENDFNIDKIPLPERDNCVGPVKFRVDGDNDRNGNDYYKGIKNKYTERALLTDNDSHGYNFNIENTGFGKLTDNGSYVMTGEGGKEYQLFSLYEMFKAFYEFKRIEYKTEDKYFPLRGTYFDLTNRFGALSTNQQKRIDLLKEYLEGIGGNNVRVEAYGRASKSGDSKANIGLSNGRALTAAAWLFNYDLFPNMQNVDFKFHDAKSSGVDDSDDNNLFTSGTQSQTSKADAKRFRNAYVVIKFTTKIKRDVITTPQLASTNPSNKGKDDECTGYDAKLYKDDYDQWAEKRPKAENFTIREEFDNHFDEWEKQMPHYVDSSGNATPRYCLKNVPVLCTTYNQVNFLRAGLIYGSAIEYYIQKKNTDKVKELIIQYPQAFERETYNLCDGSKVQLCWSDDKNDKQFNFKVTDTVYNIMQAKVLFDFPYFEDIENLLTTIEESAESSNVLKKYIDVTYKNSSYHYTDFDNLDTILEEFTYNDEKSFLYYPTIFSYTEEDKTVSERRRDSTKKQRDRINNLFLEFDKLLEQDIPKIITVKDGMVEKEIKIVTQADKETLIYECGQTTNSIPYFGINSSFNLYQKLEGIRTCYDVYRDLQMEYTDLCEITKNSLRINEYTLTGDYKEEESDGRSNILVNEAANPPGDYIFNEKAYDEDLENWEKKVNSISEFTIRDYLQLTGEKPKKYGEKYIIPKDPKGNNDSSTTVNEYLGFHKVENGEKKYGGTYFIDKNKDIWVYKDGSSNEIVKYGEISEDIEDRVLPRVYDKSSYNGFNLDKKKLKKLRKQLRKQYSSQDSNKYRYDQEYHFFKDLSTNKPLLFQKLTERLQYFDPAFHSMTPEGFNGRLTFLQQCMRQGNTKTFSDQSTSGRTASNLAFGRPPFCVLRLGDFYNQIIVIENLSIDYGVSNGIQWDLNSEGIGMQPMLAQVNLSFKFVGGGDLSGPIRRLQNACTFNYYANATLYDNRADRITYNWDSQSCGALDYGVSNKDNDNWAYTGKMYESPNKE